MFRFQFCHFLCYFFLDGVWLIFKKNKRKLNYTFDTIQNTNQKKKHKNAEKSNDDVLGTQTQRLYTYDKSVALFHEIQNWKGFEKCTDSMIFDVKDDITNKNYIYLLQFNHFIETDIDYTTTLVHQFNPKFQKFEMKEHLMGDYKISNDKQTMVKMPYYYDEIKHTHITELRVKICVSFVLYAWLCFLTFLFCFVLCVRVFV